MNNTTDWAAIAQKLHQDCRALESKLAEATKQRDHLKKLINDFCANQKWAAESWKAQKHVKPLFDFFMEDKSNE